MSLHPSHVCQGLIWNNDNICKDILTVAESDNAVSPGLSVLTTIKDILSLLVVLLLMFFVNVLFKKILFIFTYSISKHIYEYLESCYEHESYLKKDIHIYEISLDVNHIYYNNHKWVSSVSIFLDYWLHLFVLVWLIYMHMENHTLRDRHGKKGKIIRQQMCT